MITLKEWNSLPVESRRLACSMVFSHMPERFQEKMSEEWHHKLDMGHKTLLSCIYKIEGKEPRYICRIDVVL